ncbi:MAG TPA: C-GCAxxG-C-C family protein [Desulfosporosinus sp.]
MKKSDVAVECLTSGYNCAQAVFSTYCSELGLEPEVALRIAGGFGGGMGIGETCGAVTGAFMLIGLKHGNVNVDDKVNKRKTNSLVQEFTTRFKVINDSVKCKDLLAYDISIPEEMVIVREKKLFSTICPKLIKDSAEIIEELLELSK